MSETAHTDGSPTVVLVHGAFADGSSWNGVIERVIVPYLRGFGTTRFPSDETFRNGEQGALALDVIALLDALELESATLAGFDWGARSADIVAAVWPERCSGLLSVSGYLIVNPEANQQHSHRVLEGIGHNVPQEAPEAFADAILEVGGGK